MYLLDTDHLSVLERGGVEAQRLSSRLANIPAEEIAATIVSYEEQTRGWLAYRATLLTRNLSDFGQVLDLQAEDWTT